MRLNLREPPRRSDSSQLNSIKAVCASRGNVSVELYSKRVCRGAFDNSASGALMFSNAFQTTVRSVNKEYGFDVTNWHAPVTHSHSIASILVARPISCHIAVAIFRCIAHEEVNRGQTCDTFAHISCGPKRAANPVRQLINRLICVNNLPVVIYRRVTRIRCDATLKWQ